MEERMDTSTFIGIVIGVGVGFGVAIALSLIPAKAMLLATGIAMLAGLGAGFMAGSRTSKPRRSNVRLTGRVFPFPQGPYYIEIALRRAGFVRSKEE